MATTAERIEELLDLAQEVDFPALRALDHKLHLLLEQKEQDQPRTEQSMSVQAEFCRQYPRVAVDPDLFALVGIHRENPAEEDKTLIRESVTRRLRT